MVESTPKFIRDVMYALMDVFEGIGQHNTADMFMKGGIYMDCALQIGLFRAPASGSSDDEDEYDFDEYDGFTDEDDDDGDDFGGFDDTLYVEDVTGIIGEWLDSDCSGIPDEALLHLQSAYEICAKAL